MKHGTQSVPGEGALVDSMLLRLSAAALDTGLKKGYGPTHPQAGAFTPEFLQRCAALLTLAANQLDTLLARNAVLEPKCDVCGLPDQGLGLTRVVCGQQDGGALEYLLGVCCEEKPFRIPQGARRVLGIKNGSEARR